MLVWIVFIEFVFIVVWAGEFVSELWWHQTYDAEWACGRSWGGPVSEMRRCPVSEILPDPVGHQEFHRQYFHQGNLWIALLHATLSTHLWWIFLFLNKSLLDCRTIMEQLKQFSRIIHSVWRAEWFVQLAICAWVDVIYTQPRKDPSTLEGYNNSLQRLTSTLQDTLIWSMNQLFLFLF